MTQALMTSLGARDVLSRFTLFHTRDLDEARSRVADVFCPHELTFAGRGGEVDTRMQHARIRGVSINRLGYGATVSIDAGCLNDFLLVMMPLAGHAEVRCGAQQIHATPELASVVTPTLPLTKTIYDQCDQIMVKIDRSLLENVCAQHLGHALRKPLEFGLGLPMSSQGGVSWQALVSYVVSEFEHRSPTLASSLAAVQIEHLLVTTLLMVQPSNYRDELLNPSQSIAPRHVRRVEEYIDANADQDLTVGDLAAHANVSTSALFAGFREFRNTTPMAYLKSVRMQRVHEELRDPTSAEKTVTCIATHWGFHHLGHFAIAYKARFGESPSRTREKALA
ncbi:AraC family transcriptional regulator [Aromatoleum toluclasticum]|uniref:AraC family transcriptional regulator n=1 Tax=Aromatoleum toluclasticum TaxID=92003 RepID=UPI001D193F65|nr:AraC family transcriptional regulator [Aromatoleum toluclasticum]MCC4118276.1 AraC family transcriptional regulator [Aromatoleum toluclasticum]